MSFLAPYFELYEGELKELIIDLDKLVERKKSEWLVRISETEAKLTEEKRLHSESKAVIARKDEEVHFC